MIFRLNDPEVSFHVEMTATPGVEKLSWRKESERLRPSVCCRVHSEREDGPCPSIVDPGPSSSSLPIVSIVSGETFL